MRPAGIEPACHSPPICPSYGDPFSLGRELLSGVGVGAHFEMKGGRGLTNVTGYVVGSILPHARPCFLSSKPPARGFRQR